MLERIEQMLEKSESFSFETTLSGLTHLNFIKKAKEKGYGITFFFVYLANVDPAIERVAIRVSKGGHSIPKDIIERRYYKGLRNFSRYANEANDWYIYDNSGNGYELVAKKVNDAAEIINFGVFKIITDKRMLPKMVGKNS
jgi:predicted ABC-type ATPase